MLKLDLKERFSIKQALDHKFFKLRMEEFINIKDILNKLNFKEYEEYIKLKVKNSFTIYIKACKNVDKIWEREQQSK